MERRSRWQKRAEPVPEPEKPVPESTERQGREELSGPFGAGREHGDGWWRYKQWASFLQFAAYNASHRHPTHDPHDAHDHHHHHHYHRRPHYHQPPHHDHHEDIRDCSCCFVQASSWRWFRLWRSLGLICGFTCGKIQWFINIITDFSLCFTYSNTMGKESLS